MCVEYDKRGFGVELGDVLGLRGREELERQGVVFEAPPDWSNDEPPLGRMMSHRKEMVL